MAQQEEHVGDTARAVPVSRWVHRIGPGVAALAVLCGIGVAAAPGGAFTADPVASSPTTAVPEAVGQRDTRANRGADRRPVETPSEEKSSSSPSALPRPNVGKRGNGSVKAAITPSRPSTSASSGGSSSGSGSGGSAGSGTSGSMAPCPSGSAVENGLRPNAIKVHRDVCHKFPQLTSYGGVRADSLPEHPSGRALDIMISSNATGWEVARYLRANAGRLGISQVIFDQQIWTVQRSGEGWRMMPDRGGTTANHRDHVHVTVYG